jgi:hypothetical protein
VSGWFGFPLAMKVIGVVVGVSAVRGLIAFGMLRTAWRNGPIGFEPRHPETS